MIQTATGSLLAKLSIVPFSITSVLAEEYEVTRRVGDSSYSSWGDESSNKMECVSPDTCKETDAVMKRFTEAAVPCAIEANRLRGSAVASFVVRSGG